MRQVAVGGASAVTLAMAALCAAPAVAANGCAAPNAAQQVVCTYTTPSATPYTLTLPPAVDLLSLDIYGAQGGDAGSASGGLGARANGLWNLDGGPTSLEIAVGGRGVGLAGGGPNGGYGRARTGSVPGGGGGGSSTVVADGVVLGIAAGGGGAAHPPPGSATGAAGGNAGSQGGNGAVVGIARGGGGGQAATHLTPGAAGGFVSGSLCGSGTLDFPATAGLSDGHGGLGGMAFYDVPGGGGGGGGLAGGGGGGGGESCSYRDQDTGNWVTRGGGGGGGGGGSSYAGGGGAESTAVYDGRAAPRHGDGTVTVRFTVPPNYAPTAGSDVFAVSSGARFRIPAPGVLANDDDRNLDSLSAVLVTQPGHGTVTLADDGSLTYEFPRYFSGTETFTYRATDGDAQSAPATVTLHVTGDTPPPPPPTPPPPDGPVPPRPDEPRAAAADLALTIRAPARTRVGRRATYRIRVRNIGPSRATGVTATVRLPRRLRLLRDGRSCKTRGKARRTVTCRLPALAASKAADLRFVTRAIRRGPARISAQVRGAETDPRSTNNTVRVATRLQRHRRR